MVIPPLTPGCSLIQGTRDEGVRGAPGAREAAPLCGIDDLRVDDVFVRHIGSDLLANANEKRLELQDSQSEFVNRAVVDR